MLTSENKGKLSVLLRCSKKMSIPCNKILGDVLAEINGRGGGRPDMAQGSGDLAPIGPLEKKVKALIMEQL
jgi:alanyl-tRNA synthetase